MLSDKWGYGLTTDDRIAVERLDCALTSYVAWRRDAVAHLDAAIEADPAFALPHAVKGILMTGLRKPELYPAVRAELEAAKSGRPPTKQRERLYIAALESALAGRIAEAASHYEQIALGHPHDLFALRLAQFELFWIGEVAWMCNISERAAVHWFPDLEGYPAFLSIRSFGHEEKGAYALAERCGREAVERDPSDCWGTHAVAHVLIMQGRLKEGIDWVRGLSDNWSEANHIVHHLWWHLALFLVESGDFDAALDIYDRRLRDLGSPLMQAMPDFYVDIQNDTALLQRLELRGVNVGNRWADVAELARARIGNHASPFTSAHSVLALAAAGQERDAAELVRLMRAFVAEAKSDLGPRYALAAVPASEAAIAYRQGRHQAVIDLLMPARWNLWQMGGSHAQRDLFFQILADSALRLGRADVLTLLLQELNALGFDHLAERSSYADAVAFVGKPT